MNNSFVETLIGAAVLVIAGAFVFYAYSRTDTGTVSGYQVIAKFDRIDGISNGSDVRMSGIKVGTVTSLDLDQQTYRALVHMSIASNIKIPDDSSIRVATVGLLGGSYLAISPGGSDTMMAENSEFQVTQGSVDLVGLLGKVMFNDDSSKQSPPAPAPSTEPAPSTPTPQ
ncbi:MAG: outer membrane lipid asymmetry maintenance protein MlaD [Alphaproteobacteria bacterium]|nr:outer membrane lipid asymmetry maintenance protein MlaD [Alphaproteobacteria bacterium]